MDGYIVDTSTNTDCTKCTIEGCGVCVTGTTETCSDCATGYTRTSDDTACIMCEEGCKYCGSNCGRSC